MKIKAILKKAERFFLNNEAWLFGVAIFCVSLILTTTNLPYTWYEYLRHLGLFFVLFSPMLVFIYHKKLLTRYFSHGKYLILWSACFIVNQAIVALVILPGWLKGIIDPFEYDAFITMGLVFLSLEVALEINAFLMKKLPGVQWIKKIGLEKAILSVILLVSVTLALMAVSSLGIPEYDMEDRLLVGTVLDMAKIAENFATFLSFSLQFIIFYLAGYFFYYVNHYFLIPQLLKQKGILIYAIGITGTVVVFYPVLGQLLTLLPLNKRLGGTFTEVPFDSDNALGAFAIMVFTLPIILAIQWFKQNNAITSLEKEKIQTELDLLKQQINPHFFFNTLNNLYSLSLTKSDKTPEMIMRLSELMRYVIYKGKEEQVNIIQEVRYIEDYIHLQHLRLHKKVTLKFEKVIEDDNLMLPPLLLIILVENAYKHGVEPAEAESFLNIHLRSTGKSLTFICENSFEPQQQGKRGIGLNNLKRRLELLFPGKHQLHIEHDQKKYNAALKIFFE
ncbi:sensor histidine kinase [Fulvivirga imtechensis]|nr:sensor histidine kinase [Fulvivirga imtechensis]